MCGSPNLEATHVDCERMLTGTFLGVIAIELKKFHCPLSHHIGSYASKIDGRKWMAGVIREAVLDWIKIQQLTFVGQSQRHHPLPTVKREIADLLLKVKDGI